MSKRKSKDDNSDDSGDSDYNPGKKKPTKKSKAAPAYVEKEGVTQPLQLFTPDPTPTEGAFPTQFEGHLQFHNQQALTPDQESNLSAKTPAYALNGMLQHDDEVLKAMLNFSRRGAADLYSRDTAGHCSRDTADLWFYILGLFFKQEEGYYLTVSDDYKQQNNIENNGDDIPGGQPITVQVWKQEGHYHPLYRQWVRTAQIPVLVVVCGSDEQHVTEYPAVRHQVNNAQTLPVKTPLQQTLYTALSSLLNAHNDLVAEGCSSATALKSLNGAIACGTMVRFLKLKSEETGMGVFRTWSARGIDLVSGDPSSALNSVEKVLMRILYPGTRGKMKIET